MDVLDDKFAEAFLQRLGKTFLRSRCATAQEAEQVADQVAACLGLHQKTVVEQGGEFTYQDVIRNVKLYVTIDLTNYHGRMSCWAFSCSAGRVGDSFRLEPKNSYRKIPKYFKADATSVVEAVVA